MAELLSVFGTLSAYASVDLKDATEKIGRILFLEAKIRLLLNPSESDHASLIALIHQSSMKLRSISQRGGVDLRSLEELYAIVEKIVPLAQGILKREWNRVKAGE